MLSKGSVTSEGADTGRKDWKLQWSEIWKSQEPYKSLSEFSVLVLVRNKFGSLWLLNAVHEALLWLVYNTEARLAPGGCTILLTYCLIYNSKLYGTRSQQAKLRKWEVTSDWEICWFPKKWESHWVTNQVPASNFQSQAILGKSASCFLFLLLPLTQPEGGLIGFWIL